MTFWPRSLFGRLVLLLIVVVALAALTTAAVFNHDRAALIAKQFGDTAAVAGGNEQAARPLEDVAEPLAGEADRRRVDQRLDFIDIVAPDAEE